MHSLPSHSVKADAGAAVPEPRVITLRDIATDCGVSMMTVSRCLRGDTRVRPLVACKIRETADRMGYRRDPLLSSLSARRNRNGVHADHYVFPFITNWDTPTHWTEVEHFRLLFEGAKKQAEALGYRVEHFWLRQEGLTPARASRILYHRGIRGILVAPSQSSAAHLRLGWGHFSSVAFGNTIRKPALHYVANHQFATMQIICRHLRRSRYKRLGLFLPAASDNRSMNQWSAAFSFDQAKFNRHRSVPPLLLSGNWLADPRIFFQWLKQWDVDAVISLDGRIADWIREAGLRVPEEVGFAHLDLPSRSGEMAGAYQFPEELGAAGVDTLNSMVRNCEFGVPQRPRGVLMPGAWIQGKTVRPPVLT